MGFGTPTWADPARHDGGSLPARDVQPKLSQACVVRLHERSSRMQVQPGVLNWELSSHSVVEVSNKSRNKILGIQGGYSAAPPIQNFRSSSLKYYHVHFLNGLMSFISEERRCVSAQNSADCNPCQESGVGNAQLLKI
ncbi:hypothetical protein SETIT_2G285800v2 [Setaria italica]|uniref:Uncharacterized protein n=1 Tax=Setaria italica TaxID=4555 RepID=A0A368Q412_SETIT|nr:uncharacterized protein LOC101766307 isoform X1 [Setaria italica]RCV12648.1 hypothetical protein SETIT_2G285800v2 [Setaria italica]RCV12649.1 hypothetical protein SETIT_2G285800v2 [Setaria italica]